LLHRERIKPHEKIFLSEEDSYDINKRELLNGGLS